MDNATEQELVARLKTNLADKTVILITHRGNLLSLVDRVVVVDSGRVMADGPKAEVLNKLSRKEEAA
jgi:ATP-binding cassette subfamily C protein LapB